MCEMIPGPKFLTQDCQQIPKETCKGKYVIEHKLDQLKSLSVWNVAGMLTDDCVIVV